MSELASSVIIPVWNGARFLEDCLDAVLAQENVALEVIVVDNASDDGSADFVAAKYPAVRLIRSEQNLGFAGGCNAGLKAAQGDVLVLLNQDTCVRPGWLYALVGALQERKVGVAGCKILYPDGETIQHAGGWVEWPLGLAYHHGQGEHDTGQWDVPRTVEYVTGAAMALRRDVLERVGFLDQEFWPGYFEDTDFCLRVREAGYKVLYIPDAVLVHQENTSIKNPRVTCRACQRGRLRFVLKHMPPHRFLTEFVPAEAGGRLEGVWSQERCPAYLEATLVAAHLLRERWQADDDTIREVLCALQRLYQQAWEMEWRESTEPAGVVAGPLAPLGSRLRAPVLTLGEYEFLSSAPVIGPLIARFRSLWYGIAARWGIHHLMLQQEAINRQQEMYIQSLEQRLTALAAENEFLAQEIARLVLRLDSGKE